MPETLLSLVWKTAAKPQSLSLGVHSLVGKKEASTDLLGSKLGPKIPAWAYTVCFGA